MEQKGATHTKKKPFYGWFVVVACCLVYMCVIGIMNNSSSNYIVPVSTELGIGRSTFMVGQLISQLLGIVPALFIFKIFKKVSYRIILPISFLIVVGVQFSYSFVTAVYQIYILAIIQALFGVSTNVAIMATAINNWFVKRRGFVLGLVMSFSGIGGMIFNPIIANIISIYGWRTSYQIMACFLGLIMIPSLAIFLRLKPEEKGQLPYGAEETTEMSSATIPRELEGMTRPEAIKTKNFWRAAYVLLTASFACQGFLLNGSPIYMEMGHTQVTASTFASITMFCIIVGKFLLGSSVDRFGVKKSGTAFYGLLAIAYTMQLGRASMVVAIIAAAIGGIAIACNTVMPPLITVELFGDKDSGNILVLLNAFVTAASALSSIIPGLIYDLIGSYNLMLIIWVAMLVLSVIIMSVTMKWKYGTGAMRRAANMK